MQVEYAVSAEFGGYPKIDTSMGHCLQLAQLLSLSLSLVFGFVLPFFFCFCNLSSSSPIWGAKLDS